MTDPAASTNTPRSLAKWITVAPGAATITPSQSLTLDVTMKDEAGDVVTGQPEQWTTGDSAVATVDHGIVTAHAIGATKIVITSGIQSAYADITVANTVLPPNWVSVSPGTGQVSVRCALTLLSSVTDASGNQVHSVSVSWSSANLAIATVDATGSVIGVSPGTVDIVARTGSNQATAQITVVAAPAPPAPVTPPASSAPLFSNYSGTSPHWQHIRTAMTDFYPHDGWSAAERQWVGQHYDLVMSGDFAAWKAVNPSVQHYQYVLLQATLLPPGGNVASQWYSDAKQWYAAHPQYALETAFLHRQGQPADSAHRLQPFGWDTYTWIINPGDAGLREYQVDRFRRLSANHDGLFIDSQASGDLEKNLKDAASTTGSREYPNSATGWPPSGQYYADYTALVSLLKQGVGSKVLQPNTGGYNFPSDFGLVSAAGATHMEKANNPLSSNLPATWSWVDKLLGAGVSANLVDALDYADARFLVTQLGGTVDSAYWRIKMGELASYYMVVPVSPERLQLQLVNMWDHPASALWLKAQEANIGHPTQPRRQVTAGVPAADAVGQRVLVYERDFDRALVIFRAQVGWNTQRYDNATVVTVPLPAGESWLPLHADGTLGSPVTSVNLRNAEAAILVKARTI